MRLIIVKSDKDDIGQETLDRIVALSQEFETPCTQEETKDILILGLRSNEAVNDFLYAVLIGKDLNSLSGEVLILQDGDPSVVEESLDQLTELIIDLCMHLDPTRVVDNVRDLVIHDILHDCPDDENLDEVLEARILNFKDNTTIKAICKYFIAKQPTPDTTH